MHVMKRDLHKTKGRTNPSFRYTKKRSARKDRFQRRRKPGNPQYLRKRKTLDAQTIEKLVQDAILYIPIEAVPETAQKRKRLMRRPKNYSHLKKRKPGNPNLKRPARHLSSSVINNMVSVAITEIMAEPEIPTVTVPEEKPVQPLSSSLIDTMVSEAITEIVSEPEIPSVTEPAEKLPGKRPYYLLLIPLVAIIAFVFLYHSPMSQPSFVKEKRFAKTWRTELGLTYQSAGEDTEDLDDIIMDYLKDNDIDPSSLSYVVENLETSERYSLNPDTDRFAGSTYKLPLAMIWLDKVAEGEITLSDSLWYAKYYFEDGSYDFEHIDGDIYVSLQMVIKSVLRNSDNTAGHILFENLGGWSSFRELQKK